MLCLKDAYGANKTRAILAYIRAIMVGNAWGNMFDALRFRIKGSPTAGFTFLDELAVIIGPIIFILLIVLIKVINKITKLMNWKSTRIIIGDY